jgi:ketosteroid isomerase-like protein
MGPWIANATVCDVERPIRGKDDVVNAKSSVRPELARACYRAYAAGDRDAVERLMADDLVFSSPPDVGLDRAQYFERCWPNAGTLTAFAFERLVEIGGDEVLVTYVATRTDGTRFRNTEILGFDGDRIARVEVYFGWDL